ncbi:hypothetical protein D3C72_2048660 [compost metagenome]
MVSSLAFDNAYSVAPDDEEVGGRIGDVSLSPGFHSLNATARDLAVVGQHRWIELQLIRIQPLNGVAFHPNLASILLGGQHWDHIT